MVAHRNKIVPLIYRRLYKQFGPQSWWPAKTRFEVIVGAILTQNTNWGNVERALANLKARKVLNPRALFHLSDNELAQLIKPAGYFNVKARRLKNFLTFFFSEYNGLLARMKKEETAILRDKLLGVNGIGPETADSILLYALDKPAFVVDAYTKRIFSRHRIVGGDDTYHIVQQVFRENIPSQVRLYNEYHALIVRLAKDFCKTRPQCDGCPLQFLNEHKRYQSFSAKKE